jgi:hypothetical protein
VADQSCHFQKARAIPGHWLFVVVQDFAFATDNPRSVRTVTDAGSDPQISQVSADEREEQICTNL